MSDVVSTAYERLLDGLAEAEDGRHAVIERFRQEREHDADDPIHREWDAADEQVAKARQALGNFARQHPDLFA